MHTIRTFFFQTVTLGKKDQTKTENQTCEELKEKNRMSELKPTKLRKVRGLNLYSRTHLVYKIHPNEIPCNGLSDYVSKNEEEECLRNRFFWWRKDLVVFVIHEKEFGIDIGPVLNAPLEEQTLISVVKSTGESIVRVPDSHRKCCYSK